MITAESALGMACDIPQLLRCGRSVYQNEHQPSPSRACPDGRVVRISAGACANVASDLGLGDGFRCVFRFSLSLTTG